MPRGANRASLPGPPVPPAATKRQSLYLQLRAAIEQGTLAPGSRLPPSRDQARTLGVARNTVLWALARLTAEGYLQARVGDGTWVAAGVTAGPGRGAGLRAGRPAASSAATGRPAVSGPAAAAPVVARPPSLQPEHAALSRRGRLIADTALHWQPPRWPALPFRIGAPEVATFPFGHWDRLLRQAGAEARQAHAQYLDPAGVPALREAVAHWLWASRGIRCTATQVVVCSGSQQALDLIARVLLDPGDPVLLEDPGYPGLRACLQAHGAAVQGLPLDDEGLCIDGAGPARLAVVTPTHQYPLGVHMSLARRLALMAWARRHGGWIVEDDYDGEFQYGPHRIPALTSLPHDGRVLYVGTFSKTLHPGLRLGFVVAPESLAPTLAMAKALSDRHGPGDAQLALARFIGDGHLLRHLNRMRALYQDRQAALIDALHAASRGALHLAPCSHGMHLAHRLADGADDQGLSAAAGARDVVLAPLSRYAIASPRRGWLFGYAAHDAAELRAAAQRVGPLLFRRLRN